MSATVESGTRRFTRDEFMDRAARAAGGFSSLDLSEGGVLAVLLRNDIPFLECMLAAGAVGAYCVPINWHYTPEEVAHILADARPSHLVIHADLLHALATAIPPDIEVLVVNTPPEVSEAYGVPPALATAPHGTKEWEQWLRRSPRWSGKLTGLRGSMFYTSGTTGRPKAVRRDPIPPERREEYARLRGEWFGFRPGLRTAIVGPLYHSVQSTYAYAALQVDGTVALAPKFDPEGLLRSIEQDRLTHLHLVPTMMQRLLRLPEPVRHRCDLTSLEFVIHGAAPCPPEIKRRLIDWWGPRIHEYYGTSEAGMVTRASSEEWLARPGTVGRPLAGRVVRVLDEAGREVERGREGLVHMNLGLVPNFTYHNADDRRRSIEREGLITTGDIGYVDDGGYLFLCDRRDDVIIAGGVKIWPAEVEAVLIEHASVADCAVFGIPDAEFGQVPAAAVQPLPGCDIAVEELKQFLALRLARFKLPRRIDVHDALPRDDSGKIYRRVLRESMLAAGELIV